MPTSGVGHMASASAVGLLEDLPRDQGELRDVFLSALDRQGAVKTAGRLVARYLNLGHPVEPLIATLARAVLRKDAQFHTSQMLEAGVQQYREWGGCAGGQNSDRTWPLHCRPFSD